jgi:uncharacterized protein involved in outer membrane biogenesis
MRPTLKWLAVFLLAVPAAAMAFVAIFGWNWARGPIERATTERTGRQLVIAGDLKVGLAWPAPRIRAAGVSFANPAWAREKQMVAAEEVDFTVDLLQLLRGRLALPEVALKRPVVFLELAPDGRKTWLLDADQSDETARVPIGRLTLDDGRLGYDDAKLKTSIRAEISTRDSKATGATAGGVVFSAKGLYKGLALAARGSGGSVLALHDASAPYPLEVEATVGRTALKAEGTITSLLTFSAMDMRLALRGDSLALLTPLFGIAFPDSNPYTSAGRVLHEGQTWRYEKFSGRVGKSDLAGTLQVDAGGARPSMRGELASQVLEFSDLGPLIGTSGKAPAAAPAAATRAAAAPATPAAGAPAARALPDIPFKTDGWDSVDADVTLRAKTFVRARQLPLENLVVRLKLENSLLVLDPVDFGVAGGHLKGVISLDGRQKPIQARARIGARKVDLAKLFPSIKLAKTSIGQINGDLDLAGRGDSVGRMLAASDGSVRLVLENGEISRLLMEQIGLHVLEVVHLKLAGDKAVKLRCAVADFSVKRGVMQANALVLDTEVSTIAGTGSIDLAREKLDLTFVPKTRSTSPVALRTPIYITGSFSRPDIGLDKSRIAARSAGAILLGIVNPLLALIPLVEMGPGVRSECARLIQEAQSPG